ncbi:hypothetical protein [Pseudoroseicyclus aestuarii]|uniref:Uncharacterized protein n=1 Tax=Pseudoroseicyclus aestuarii TaxID=1795041 RepID=A0A318SM16_9RHOB|nr:hypothetical protein [Pseudoroseicyclus aestuarii]PYE80864.1 hypothetical protein DFP88_11028 [Pseudoroseicyclus aestuarii]
MIPILPPVPCGPLAEALAATAMALPADLPPPPALQPPPDQPGAAIRLVARSPLHRALARSVLGATARLSPNAPSFPVSSAFAWIDAAGAIVPGAVTEGDLCRIGTVQFPEGPVAVPGAWPPSGPEPLDDGEVGFGPLRATALLRLAMAAVDQQGIDLLLRPEPASILVLPADLIAPTAWVLTHAARASGDTEAPLRLLMLPGGGGDAAALDRALLEDGRLLILAAGPVPPWPEDVPPPDWLGLPPLDAALLAAQFRLTWPDEAGPCEAGLPPDASLARLTAADIALIFRELDPPAALDRLGRLMRRFA